MLVNSFMEFGMVDTDFGMKEITLFIKIAFTFNGGFNDIVVG